jgi:hypothetical protein
LEPFLTGRLDSVAKQLAGRGQAFVPAKLTGLQLAAAWTEHRRDSLMQSAIRALRSVLSSPTPAPIRKADLLTAAQQWIARPGVTERVLAESLAGLLPIPENFVFEPGPGTDWAAIIFRHADADRNGQLTPQELLAAIETAFGRGDANKDGALSDAELRRALLRLAVRP